MTHSRTTLLTAALLLGTLRTAIGDPAAAETDQAISLAVLAARADAVVLAQARDTDYVYRREFPVEGSAFLKVLIAYKLDQPQDIIEVHEQGLHPHECYFPDPTVFEEGRRYLLFLQKDKEKDEDEDKAGRYRGTKHGCALDVLVARDNRYVLRLPVTGIRLSDPLAEMATPYQFADAYAVEDERSLPPSRRDELLAAGYIERSGDHYVYTRGVALSAVRRLMKLNGVSAARLRLPNE